MSGIKDQSLGNFYRSLHARGLDITALAKALNCGRSHLSQVLSGKRPGSQTWRKILRSQALTDRELMLLGKLPAYVVPRETNSHVEQQETALSP